MTWESVTFFSHFKTVFFFFCILKLLLKYSWLAVLIYALHQWLIHTHTRTVFIFVSTVVYHRILDLVPCAIQWDLVHPSCIYQFASANSHSQSIPPRPSSPGAATHLFSVSGVCCIGRFICGHILDSTYKWYGVCPSLSDLLDLIRVIHLFSGKLCNFILLMGSHFVVCI